MSTNTDTKKVTVNCPACDAVNVDADVNTKCFACGEPVGSAVLQHILDELKKATGGFKERMAEINAPSFKTFNGFGTTLLDYRQRDDGAWEATRWVVAVMVPVVPLASYVIRPKRQQNSYGRMESYFDILGRAPLSAAKILRPYALVLVGLAPIILGFTYSKSNSTLRGPWGALAMLVSAVWAGYIIFFKIKNDSKAYKKADAAKPS
jgi:hypothetical protein